MTNPTNNRFTVAGRYVQGDMYNARTNKKQPEKKPYIYFAVAVPKGVESAWTETTWGAEMAQNATGAFPQFKRNGAFNPPAKFSWKVEDGDATEPNDNGAVNAETEGFAGNWILKSNSRLGPPKIYRRNPQTGAYELYETKDAIRKGDFVEARFSHQPNTPKDPGADFTPGLYLQADMINFLAYGQPIYSFINEDAQDVFNPSVALPAGASLVPLAESSSPLQTSSTRARHVPEDHTQAHTPQQIAQATMAVKPHTSILTGQSALTTPSRPSRPSRPTPAEPIVKHGQWSYAELKGDGWTDEELRQEGYID